ncbi:hypothetical protein HAHE_37240 [Haloferula helveola]|uniref:PEP-CTERM protein-sorting domain-containing protein n=1 Tax=Haloferula helveola TaxID=490095 RepID=A0ABM7RR20_9BACT|nr:hypothetical protein HAHE_37240 [Haloferula helveola]
MTRRSIPILLALTTLGEGALVFNIDGIGPDASPTASAGAIGAGDDGTVNVAYSQSPATINGETSVTLILTVTSLTLDGNGFDDDTAVLNFSLVSSGGTINHTTDLGVSGNGAGRISDVSESLTFAYTGGTITLGAGAAAGDMGVIDFIGFNQIGLSQFDNVDGDIATLALGTGSPVNVTTNEFSFSADPGDMTVGYAQGGAANDGFKVNHFRSRFSFDVVSVPEPSVAFVVALGAGVILPRRRR